MTRRVLLAVMVLQACGGDDGEQQSNTTLGTSISMTTSATETGNDEDDCPLGSESCPCTAGGGCDGELVCASQTCVDFGDSGGADEGETDKPPPEDTGADESGGDVEGSCENNCFSASPHLGGLCFCDPSCGMTDTCCPDYETACPGQCLFPDDCASDEVCNSAQECVPAWGQIYDVCVDNWADFSPTCWDFDDCFADVYYTIYYGGTPVFTSTTQNDSTQASWSDCFAMEFNSDIDDGTQSNKVLSIVFTDADGAGSDDPMNVVCYAEGGSCTYLPLLYLHEGGLHYDHDASYPFDFQIRLVALAE